MGYVRETIPQDVYDLAPILREEDKQEVIASVGQEPEYALFKSYQVSNHCLSIVCNCGDEEQVVGMFGVMRMNDTQGAVWMLASDKLIESKKHTTTFLRHTREWTDKLNDIYPILMNIVDARNKAHIKWIKWSGFSFLNERPWGVSQLPFIEFARIKTNV